MATLRFVCRKILNSNKDYAKLIPNNYTVVVRLHSYQAKYYNESNPAPKFFDNEVQYLLKTLTRIDLNRVYKKRKLGGKRLEEPVYKFMTTEQLQEAVKEAAAKANEILQMPPVVSTRKPIDEVLFKDPALKGLDTSRYIFTDITFGLRDSERLIVTREPDGTLRKANWSTRDRINQVYFPKPSRLIRPPTLFEDQYLDDLLKRQEYEYVLDRACTQFEPNDPEYQRVTSIVYQCVNGNNDFELLRSTRHFGNLVFFLVWNKEHDNLLLDLIETSHINEVESLVTLYGKIHNVAFEESNLVESFILKYCNKKAALELALQAYKDLAKEKEDVEKGIKVSHGLS